MEYTLIEWFGQSCFLLTSSAGRKVLTDPFGKMGRYNLPDVEADLVTTSHNHFDHNNVSGVKGNFMHLAEPGRFAQEDVEVKGIPTYHDAHGGKFRGRNIIFKFTMDGISVCHCGDLGHVLTPEQLAEIGVVDVLLLPVGGRATIDAVQATEVMRQIRPQITIPMHYRTKALRLMGYFFSGVDKFLSAAGEKAVEMQEISFQKEDLSKYSCIIVLQYK